MKNLLQHTDSFEKLEDLPSREKVKLIDGWGRYKGRDYPHNKVRRFLESRVGVKWDDVFSEFVHLTWIKDEDKTREKLGWDVIFDTVMKDGEILYLDEGWGHLRPVSQHRWKQGTFYVHPVTKCLAYAKPKKKEPEKKPDIFHILGNYHQLIKIKGFWHEVKGKPVKVESDTVVIDGLHYQKVKKLPETNEMASGVYPPFPQKFFGRNVLTNQPKFKKTEDGYYLIPKPTSYYDRFSDTDIGPRDLMIQPPDDNSSWGRYTTRRKRENSVKIIVYRQLNSKELKKYGVKNDVQPIASRPCKVCGNLNCTQVHNNRCNICGEKWCRIHAVTPYKYAMGLGNPKI
jgi:hypothetical protein